MKKTYETPTAEKLSFDYAEVVTTSGSDSQGGGGNGGRWGLPDYSIIWGYYCWRDHL